MADEESEQSREGVLLHAYDANPKLDRAVLKPGQRDLLRISADCDEFVFGRVAEQFQIPENEPFEDFREKELIALRGLEAETVGHCDRGRYWARLKLLCVIDKKFGFKIVTPAGANYQLRTYAIGGFEAFDVENCVVAITQPRLSFSERITLAAYNQEDVIEATKELTLIRRASRQSDPPLVPGEEQCRYCRARSGKCPALQKLVAAGLAIVPSTVAGSLTKREVDLEQRLAALPNDKLETFLDMLALADFATDPAKDEARRRLEADPSAFTHYKLGKPGEIRKIVDSRKAISYLQLRGLLPAEDVFDCTTIGVRKLEDRLREKTGCTWSEARDKIQDAIGMFIEREEKRPALTRTGKTLLK